MFPAAGVGQNLAGKRGTGMKDYVYQQAMYYRKTAHTSDPFELLDSMGVEVWFSDRYSATGLRGYCTLIGEAAYVVINSKQPEEEQRIVAAHEAGHLILHTDYLMGNVLADLDVYDTTSRMEREANLFAADFLLSDEDVLERVREGESDFYHMARELCVPSDFLAFKLYSMGNRGYRFRIPVELNSRFLK